MYACPRVECVAARVAEGAAYRQARRAAPSATTCLRRTARPRSRQRGANTWSSAQRRGASTQASVRHAFYRRHGVREPSFSCRSIGVYGKPAAYREWYLAKITGRSNFSLKPPRPVFGSALKRRGRTVRARVIRWAYDRSFSEQGRRGNIGWGERARSGRRSRTLKRTSRSRRPFRSMVRAAVLNLRSREPRCSGSEARRAPSAVWRARRLTSRPRRCRGAHSAGLACRCVATNTVCSRHPYVAE
jgi:hypothetical protein